MMQVVILAGGLGTRLHAVAPETAKAMVPVAGRPFIEHQLELLKRNRLRDVVLCIGHLGEQIESHVGDGTRFEMSVRYAYEDPERLMGTGGALLNAYGLLAPEFFVMYGDSYLPVDYQAMIEWNRIKGFPAVMSVFKNDGRWDSSNARIDGDRVGFYSKKAMPGECDHIDYGLSIFRRDVISRYLGTTLPLDLAKIQGDLVAKRELGAYLMTERFYEIGKPEGLAELDAHLRAFSGARPARDGKIRQGKLPTMGNGS